MQRIIVSALLVSAALSTSRGAAAQLESDQPKIDHWRAPWAVLGHVGIGTPVGFAGVGAEYALLRYAVVEAGAGLGSVGWQGALMARLRAPVLDSTAIGVGFGASIGDYEWREGFPGATDKPAAKRAEPAVFGNVALVIEHRFGSEDHGFQMRELIGHGLVLNRGALDCTEEIEHCRADHEDDGRSVPFVGMSFGYYL